MKRLDEWLRHCESLSPSSIDLGLDRVLSVLAKSQWHQFSIPVVTFAGTNGKGSTIAALEQLLLQQNVRVGVYTSPHLIRFNERVRLAGVEASDQMLCEAFEAVEAVRGEISLTYFEFVTIAALYLFQKTELDLVLLEVGLGGRLDAVNVVDADISVITQISLDHTDWLGETLEDIGREKAGIMRQGAVTIIADPVPPETVISHAESLQLLPIDRTRFGYVHGLPESHQDCSRVGAAWGAKRWSWYGEDHLGEGMEISDLPIPNVPIVSVATALQVVAMLRPLIGDLFRWHDHELIIKAIRSTSLPGRMTYIETVGSTPLMLDIAHNQQSVEYLASRLKHWRQGGEDALLGNYAGGKITALFAALDDKSVDEMIAVMVDVIDQWAPVTAVSDRALTGQHLRDLLVERGAEIFQDNSVEFEHRKGALSLESDQEGCLKFDLNDHLLSTLKGDRRIELIVVFGSFYLVGPVLERMPEP